MKRVRMLTVAVAAVVMLASSGARAACSVEDVLALAKAGYVKAEIEAKCGAPAATAAAESPAVTPASTAPVQEGWAFATLEPLVISDGGEAKSTYTLTKGNLALDESLAPSIDKVIALAHETNWPSEIVSFEQRLDMRKRLGKHPLSGLVGYLAGVVDERDGLVLVRAEENKSAPFTVARDFFVVVSPDGLEPRE